MTIAAAGFAIFIALFYLLTLRPGVHWSGATDFSSYLTQGLNFFEGYPYAKANPGRGLVPMQDVLTGPAFPPLLPLLLGAIHQIRGFGFIAMKTPLSLFFAGAVFLCYLLFRERLRPLSTFLVVISVGLSPFLFDHKEFILSEYPFLFFIFLWFYVITKIDGNVLATRYKYVLAVAAGILLVLSYEMRTAGIVLFPTLVTYDLVRYRRIRLTSVIALATAGLGVLLIFVIQQPVIGRYIAYVAEGRNYSPYVIFNNIDAYRWGLEMTWANGFSAGLAQATSYLILILAFVGFALCVLHGPRKITIFEVFVLGYGAMMLNWPAGGSASRFLIPLFPAMFFYAFYFCERIVRNRPSIVRTVVSVGLAILIAVNYGGAYYHTNFGPLNDGIRKAETVEMFDFIAKRTPEDAVIFFRFPEILRLYTRREVRGIPSPLHGTETLDEAKLWRYFNVVDASYIVLKESSQKYVNLYVHDFSDSALSKQFVARYPDRFSVVFRNDDFTIYKIR